MHELSIALEICRIAEHQVGAARVAQIRSVDIDVGSEAGVEIESLRFCLDAILADPPFWDATPVIHLREGDGLQVNYVEVDDDGPSD